MAEVIQPVSPRADSTGQNKRKRRLWVTLIVVILFLFAAVMGISCYVTNSLIHPARKPVTLTPAAVQLSYQPITFQSEGDHIQLKGWLMKPQTPTHKWIVLSHGYTGNRLIWPTNDNGKPGLDFMKMLVQHGYNVVTFDYRNSGASGGHETTVGFKEQRDLNGAVDHIVKLDPNADVALLGWSQGAATTLLSASHSKAVKLVVADSSFANLQNYLASNLPHWSHLPEYPFTPLILNFWVPILSGLNPSTVAPIQTIQKINVPILLVHSKADEAIPVTNSINMYNNYKHSKDITLRLYPKAGHTESYILFPKEYETMLMQFFKEKGFTP